MDTTTKSGANNPNRIVTLVFDNGFEHCDSHVIIPVPSRTFQAGDAIWLLWIVAQMHMKDIGSICFQCRADQERGIMHMARSMLPGRKLVIRCDN